MPVEVTAGLSSTVTPLSGAEYPPEDRHGHTVASGWANSRPCFPSDQVRDRSFGHVGVPRGYVAAEDSLTACKGCVTCSGTVRVARCMRRGSWVVDKECAEPRRWQGGRLSSVLSKMIRMERCELCAIRSTKWFVLTAELLYQSRSVKFMRNVVC